MLCVRFRFYFSSIFFLSLFLTCPVSSSYSVSKRLWTKKNFAWDVSSVFNLQVVIFKSFSLEPILHYMWYNIGQQQQQGNCTRISGWRVDRTSSESAKSENQKIDAPSINDRFRFCYLFFHSNIIYFVFQSVVECGCAMRCVNINYIPIHNSNQWAAFMGS